VSHYIRVALSFFVCSAELDLNSILELEPLAYSSYQEFCPFVAVIMGRFNF
jgi:hypothetical protein